MNEKFEPRVLFEWCEDDDADYPIRLVMFGPDKFEVHYGSSCHVHLTRFQAAKQLGHCIMHSLQVKGKLDE